LSGGEMIRMRSGMSSVSVVVAENRLRRIGGTAFFSAVETSSLSVRVWNDCEMRQIHTGQEPRARLTS
jgi:hypothetical protein